MQQNYLNLLSRLAKTGHILFSRESDPVNFNSDLNLAEKNQYTYRHTALYHGGH